MLGSAGVYRFLFNESFSKMNSDLADIAAFVGLPLVGYEYLQRRIFVSSFSFGVATFPLNPSVVIIILIIIEAASRSTRINVRETCKILINVTGFVVPVATGCYLHQEWNGLIAIIAFVVAAIIITPDRHKFLLGVRCENWFHYIIGLAAIFIAKGLLLN